MYNFTTNIYIEIIEDLEKKISISIGHSTLDLYRFISGILYKCISKLVNPSLLSLNYIHILLWLSVELYKHRYVSMTVWVYILNFLPEIS